MSDLPFGEQWRVMTYLPSGWITSANYESLAYAMERLQDGAQGMVEATLITIWKVGTEPAPVVHHAAPKGETK